MGLLLKENSLRIQNSETIYSLIACAYVISWNKGLSIRAEWTDYGPIVPRSELPIIPPIDSLIENIIQRLAILNIKLRLFFILRGKYGPHRDPKARVSPITMKRAKCQMEALFRPKKRDSERERERKYVTCVYKKNLKEMWMF